MAVMDDDTLARMAEPATSDVVPRWVARYLDLLALSKDSAVEVIGEHGLIFDRPGFTAEFLSHHTLSTDQKQQCFDVLMPVRGYWQLLCEGQDYRLNPGDTALIQPDTAYRLAPAMSGEAGLYRIRNTDDPAGPSWWEKE